MTKTRTQIEAVELRQHLHSIIEERHPVCFRYRLIGEMWQPHFMRILRVEDQSVLLNDEVRNKIISITDLSKIIQFEFDSPVLHFQPHFHYVVTGQTT